MKHKLGPFLTFLLVAVFFFCFTILPGKRHKPQVYDCFLYNNESELLKIRLSEMYDYVDKFVLVEACETFRGQPKSFFYNETKNKHFEKYADKIIHVMITERVPTENPWNRERYQRDQILRALEKCHKNDIIFISDLDEIVRGSSIPEIVEKLTSREGQAIVCSQKMYFGFFNRYQGEWPGTVCTTYKEVVRLTPRWVRKLRNMRPATLRKGRISKMCRLNGAGWHFSSMGGIDMYINKIESFSHAELDTPEGKTKENLLHLINGLQLQEIDDTYPQVIQDNRTYFEERGYIDTSGVQEPSIGLSIDLLDDRNSCR